MASVLVLIGADRLDDDAVAAAGAALAAVARRAGPADWLAPGRACDLPFEGGPLDAGSGPAEVEAAVRRALVPGAADVAVVPAANRRKRLLVADMESTVIRQEMLDELAEFAGLRDRVAAITARAMAGELDFAQALRARVALLAGLPADVLDTVAARIELMPGAEALVRTMKAHGAATALVSGGFTVFTSRVRELCGFDEDRANRLLVEDGKLAGRAAEPILGRDAKLAALNELAAAHNLTPDDAVAVGDGANDLTMVQAAGLGVAFHAKPLVREAAPVRIDRCGLDALLYLQGYRAAEIVGGAG